MKSSKPPPRSIMPELAMAFMTMTSGQAANDIRGDGRWLAGSRLRVTSELSTWVLGL